MAAPAFAPDPRRRSLIAKVKLAQKELGIADDDYREILRQETGQTSAADCTAAQLVQVVKRFESRGFRPKPRAGTKPGWQQRPRAADHPMARKARAMWISLHQLGVVENPSDQALEAFARRQLAVERLQWADQAKSYKLIEALKAMAERAGWSQDLAGVPQGSHVHALRVRLLEAIVGKLKKLGIAARHWSACDAAQYLCGIELDAGETIWPATAIDAAASALGAQLRAAKGMDR